MIRDYCEEFNDSIFETWIKWKNSLKKMSLSKLTQEIENLSSPISTNEIDFIIKIFFIKTTLDPESLMSGFYQIFKKDIIPILCQFSQK